MDKKFFEIFKENNGGRNFFYRSSTQIKKLQTFYIPQILWQAVKFWVSWKIKRIKQLQTTNGARKTHKIFTNF